MTNRSGTHYSAPTDADRRPVILGVSTLDGITPIPLEVDPATGQLQTSGSGGGGSSNVAITDGVTTTRKATVANLTNSNPLAVEIVDGSGNQITSFGGSTQYADGATRGTATGTLEMIDDGTNIQSRAGDTSGNAFTVGNVASGATDSGNPVKVGGKYNATKPTFTDGQRGDAQLGTRGSMSVQLYVPDSTNPIGNLADSSDATATSTSKFLAVMNRGTVFNGTTWDRQYGDATNGTWVNIKAGTVTANPGALPSAIVAFVTAVSTAGTRVQLASNALTQGVILEAPSTNTGKIYIGGSTVSSTVYGAELSPGQATSFAGNNTNLIYIDASVNGDKCSALGS